MDREALMLARQTVYIRLIGWTVLGIVLVAVASTAAMAFYVARGEVGMAVGYALMVVAELVLVWGFFRYASNAPKRKCSVCGHTSWSDKAHFCSRCGQATTIINLEASTNG